MNPAVGPAGRLSLLTEPSALTVQRPGSSTAAADVFQLSADRHVGAGPRGLTPLGLLAPAVGKISTVGYKSSIYSSSLHDFGACAFSANSGSDSPVAIQSDRSGGRFGFQWNFKLTEIALI